MDNLKIHQEREEVWRCPWCGAEHVGPRPLKEVTSITIHDEPKPAARPKINRKTGGVFYPGEYRRYVRNYAEAIAGRLDLPTPVRVPVALDLRFFRSTRRRVDMDNLEKTVMDLLVSAGVLQDDSLVLKKCTQLSLGSPYPRTEIHVFQLIEELSLYGSR